MKIRKSRIATWVRALRSGKFTQTDGRLEYRLGDDEFGNKEVGHCCLGVYEQLCTGALDEDMRGQGGNSEPVKGFLSDQGIDCDFTDELADMNDAGKSFKFIATKIETRMRRNARRVRASA